MFNKQDNLSLDWSNERPLSTADKFDQYKNGTTRFGYSVATINILVSNATSSEIVDQAVVHSMPGTTQLLLGMINLRGNLIPVYDLYPLINAVRDKSQQQIILVLDKNDNAVGLSIDEFPRAIGNLQTFEQQPDIPVSFHNHISDSYRNNDSYWIDINHRTFFRSLQSQLIYS